jgi:GNAT superfamily N-acetyltransferase
MAKDLNIRIGQHRDAETLDGFNIAVARETEGRELAFDIVLAGVKHLLETSHSGFYVVAERDSQIIASLLVTMEWSDWSDGWYWWIQSVYVRPEYRRQGIYRRLYEFVKKRGLEEENVRGLRLYAEKGNAIARNVYTKLGMVKTSYRIFEEKIED